MEDPLDLAGQLIRCHVQMRIVLSKRSNAHHTVKGSGQFVAVYQPQLAHSQGQIAVGMRFAFVNQHCARTVHGFDGIVFLVNFDRVHILLVVFPVTGLFPKLP